MVGIQRSKFEVRGVVEISISVISSIQSGSNSCSMLWSGDFSRCRQTGSCGVVYACTMPGSVEIFVHMILVRVEVFVDSTICGGRGGVPGSRFIIIRLCKLPKV